MPGIPAPGRRHTRARHLGSNICRQACTTILASRLLAITGRYLAKSKVACAVLCCAVFSVFLAPLVRPDKRAKTLQHDTTGTSGKGKKFHRVSERACEHGDNLAAHTTLAGAPSVACDASAHPTQLARRCAVESSPPPGPTWGPESVRAPAC
ncbi:hypothetical protein EDC01DRAFT_273944 [Geopyxis carbonaria]|nr:hypothetical protein EDC01DRAFT_273944 [Geopyxis carbonaria]